METCGIVFSRGLYQLLDWSRLLLRAGPCSVVDAARNARELRGSTQPYALSDRLSWTRWHRPETVGASALQGGSSPTLSNSCRVITRAPRFSRRWMPSQCEACVMIR